MGVLSRRGARSIAEALAQELAKGASPSTGAWLMLNDSKSSIAREFDDFGTSPWICLLSRG